MMEVTTAALEPISSALREMLVMALLYIFQDERSTDRPGSYMGGCASWKERATAAHLDDAYTYSESVRKPKRLLRVFGNNRSPIAELIQEPFTIRK
jgi:hypothetical protein